jgi:hypothetical protein
MELELSESDCSMQLRIYEEPDNNLYDSTHMRVVRQISVTHAPPNSGIQVSLLLYRIEKL